MTTPDDNLQAQLEERLRFETLIADISSRFIDLPASQVDQEVLDAQRCVCEFLGLDACSVWQPVEGAPGMLTMTHFYRALEGPPFPDPMDGKEHLPWCLAQMMAGKVVVVSSLSQLPPEAARDRQTIEHFGVKSTVGVPLVIAGNPLLGAVAFDAMREERPWPEPLVKRLQLVSQMFANALARKRSDELLRESEARLSLAADSAGAGLWSLDTATEQFWFSERAGQLFQFPHGPPISMAALLEMVHPDDRDLIRQAVKETLRSGKEVDIEYRIVPPGGRMRWISTRGRGHRNHTGEWDRLMGASVDITARKLGEAALLEQAEEFRALTTTTPDGFWVVDARGRILETNEECSRIYGYSPTELRALSIQDIEAARNPSETQAHIEEILKLGFSRFETRHRRKDGQVIDVEVSTSYRKKPGTFVAFLRDITARKRNDEALRQSLAEIKQLKDRLQAESDYLKAEMKLTQAHDDFVGKSKAMQTVLRQVEQVAPTDSSVLIFGETGTGKELVAQAIHQLSPRRDHIIVKVNCAALPAALVESELFGREKGAFTGALTRQVGRFEVADSSTLFLDEIGELSPEVQAKLLRVLQEGVFERLGSPKPIKVNVRVIAATNRNLDEAVRKGSFREDLFYRLNVFPISVPPLRDRPEDIPQLVWAFLKEFSSRMGKKITQVPRTTMEALQRRPWPGNVRELRNVIEHAVIVTTGDTLKVSLSKPALATARSAQTLADADREHILRTLEKTAWHIKGSNGAAELLDMHPSTLYSRMKKLGIPNRHR